MRGVSVRGVSVRGGGVALAWRGGVGVGVGVNVASTWARVGADVAFVQRNECMHAREARPSKAALGGPDGSSQWWHWSWHGVDVGVGVHVAMHACRQRWC